MRFEHVANLVDVELQTGLLVADVLNLFQGLGIVLDLLPGHGRVPFPAMFFDPGLVGRLVDLFVELLPEFLLLNDGGIDLLDPP